MKLTHLLLPAQGRLLPEDVRALTRIASLLPAHWRVGNVRPSRSEQRALSRFEAISASSWDLRYRSAEQFDALVLGRSSLLGGDFQRRAASALASCRVLLILDSAEPNLPADRALGSVVTGAANVRLYRGDLTDPLLRVDDYPTGVRPILADLSSLHGVLSQIDDSGLPFHLGIVPALLDDAMSAFLRSLKHLVVSMHGNEHGYAKHSKILIDAGDPQNQRSTVTGFDEFAGQAADEIERTLRQARESLEARVGQLALSYIPPNNLANRATGRALEAIGFQYVLSERPIPGCALPCIRSDFYERSPAFRADSRPNVASLHATWEADLQRAGDAESLPKFLAALVAQRAAARAEVQRVAERTIAELATD